LPLSLARACTLTCTPRTLEPALRQLADQRRRHLAQLAATAPLLACMHDDPDL
jgi:hypothetical protein